MEWINNVSRASRQKHKTSLAWVKHIEDPSAPRHLHRRPRPTCLLDRAIVSRQPCGTICRDYGQLVPKTSRTQDNSYPWQLVPETNRTQDSAYPRQLIPGCEWNRTTQGDHKRASGTPGDQGGICTCTLDQLRNWFLWYLLSVLGFVISWYNLFENLMIIDAQASSNSKHNSCCHLRLQSALLRSNELALYTCNVR